MANPSHGTEDYKSIGKSTRGLGNRIWRPV
jgi:hypothetical protein